MTERSYIALLRGINVGGKVLKMADLKAAVQALGFTDVQTYLQSGNMLFRTAETDNAALALRISEAIRDHATIDVTVMVRSASEWSGIVAANPFPRRRNSRRGSTPSFSTSNPSHHGWRP